jgi:hypothetical protein
LLLPVGRRSQTQKVAPPARTLDKKPRHLRPGFHTLNSTQFLAFIRTAAFERICQSKLRHRTSRYRPGQHISTILGIQHKHGKCYTMRIV